MRLMTTIGLVLALAAPAAQAASAPVTLSSTEPELTPAEGGGGTVSLALTNVTDAAIRVTARPAAARPGCSVTFDGSGALPAARTTALKATLAAGCGTIDAPFRLVVEAAGTRLPVTATVGETETPDWDAVVRWFGGALVAALLLALAAASAWRRRAPEPKPSLLKAALPQLENWSVTDSWLSNVTILGGLLTGIFGTADVVEAVLGEDAEEAVALATVGAALSVAFVAGAGVLVLTARRVADGDFTSGGVLAGSALALTGAGGQLGVVYESARELELGALEGFLLPLLVAALALTAAYGYFSVLGVLVQGTKAPERVKASSFASTEPVVAAALVLEATGRADAALLDDLERAFEKLHASRRKDAGPEATAPPRPSEPRPKRSALP
jgi:hypothetical protein